MVKEMASALPIFQEFRHDCLAVEDLDYPEIHIHRDRCRYR